MEVPRHRRRRGQATAAPIANNQRQVDEAAATIVVLGDLDSYKEIGRINEATVKAGYMPEDFAKQFTENSLKLYSGLPADVLKKIVHTDGGLVSMQIMLGAIIDRPSHTVRT